MDKHEATLVVAALTIVGFFIYLSKRGYKGNPIGAGAGSLLQNMDAGGGGKTSAQEEINFAGFDGPAFAQGPNFYMANQPWQLSPPMGGVMPMNSGSVNITGGPSWQEQPQLSKM